MINLDMIYIFVQPWDVDKHKQANTHTHTAMNPQLAKSQK